MRAPLVVIPIGLVALGAVAGARVPRTALAREAFGRVAPVESLPPRLGFGRPVTEREIEKIDIDVMPDGRGLPAGSGTAAAGATIFIAKCAMCHGAAGEGVKQGPNTGPTLVGRNPGDAFDFAASLGKEGTKTIGNYWPYATTVFDYVRRAMPFDKPGSLTNQEVYALTAYLLQRNQLIADGTVIDAKSLPAVHMPARAHFVRDDRETSTRVR